MPWTVRVVKWWFVLLAVSSCAPLACMIVGCVSGHVELDEQLVMAVVAGVALIALCSGFALAVCRGPRRWVTGPYSAFGACFWVPPLVVSLFEEVTLGLIAYLVAVAVGTVVPVVLLYLPSSNRWYASLPGCGKSSRRSSILVLVVSSLILGLLGLAMAGAGNERKTLAAHTGALAMQGRTIRSYQAMNVQAREARQQWVDPTACSNSVEYVGKFNALFGAEGVNQRVTSTSAWSLAVNVPDDVPDSFPMLISANLDPSALPREWDGQTERPVELSPLDGLEPFPFKNRVVVVIRRDGTSSVIKRKYVTLKTLFNNQPFKLGENTYYLTPVGKSDLRRR